MAELTGYELSRQWFDWSYENPDKINPNHTALYFFIIEHFNRMGQPSKFGLPMEMAKCAIGIKNYRTYSKTFEDLIEWGFISLIQRSKNQWSANVIALVKNTKAHTKALSKATQKHSQKQVHGTVGIIKPITLEPNNLEQERETKVSTHSPDFIKKYENFNNWLEKNASQVLKLQKPITIDEYKSICKKIEDKEFTHAVAMDVLTAMGNKKDLLKKYVSGYHTLLSWISLRKKNENPVSNQPNQGKKFGPLSKQSQTKVIHPEERWSAITSGIDKLYLNGQRFNDMGSSFFNHFKNLGLVDDLEPNDFQANIYAKQNYIQDPDIPVTEQEMRKETELKKLREEWYLKQVVKSVPKEELLAKLQPVIFG